MISYSLLTIKGAVEVSLDATKIDQAAALSYQGSPQATDLVTQWLERQYGLLGHLLADATTPQDLAFVMQSEAAQKYQPVLTEGKAILEQKPAKPKEGEIY